VILQGLYRRHTHTALFNPGNGPNQRHRYAVFPAEPPWGAPGYQTYATLVMAFEVPEVEVGDELQVSLALTVSSKEFKDARARPVPIVPESRKPLHSLEVVTRLTAHTELPAEDGQVYGKLLWVSRSENATVLDPYKAPLHVAGFAVTKTPVWLLVYVVPESAGAVRPGQHVTIYGTSSYNCLTVWHHKPFQASVPVTPEALGLRPHRPHRARKARTK
jgi:hypothetical protein